MLELVLTVRDEEGRTIDPATIGVDRLVEVIRARPPSEASRPPDEPDVGLVRLGPALQSLASVELISRQVAALRAACVSAVADESTGWGSSDRVLDELSCALVVSRRSAQHTHGHSEAVRTQPEVWAALSRGEIDATRARILADALHEVPRVDPDGVVREAHAAECAYLFSEGLAYAQEHTARRLDLFLQRRLVSLGCAERPRRRAQGLAERGVWVDHRGDGTADLTARLASEDAERVYSAIRAVAIADRNGEPCHDPDSPREPMGVWLAAALVDLVLGPAGRGWGRADSGLAGLPDHGGTAARGTRVDTTITVTIPIDSLAGLTDEPGVVNGFGVIPAEDARRLAAGDARWRHVLTCRTSGAVLDVGALSYRPPAALDRHVRLRDGTCRFPGCEVPARECDLDHLIPFPIGPTSAANLHALCRRHHGLKHERGWRVEGLPGQALRWTSPQGTSSISHPDDTHAHAA